MGRYVLKRLLSIIPVIICVIIFIFILMYFVPGDPVSILMSDLNSTPEQEEAIRKEWGLTDPFHVQLWNYLKGVIRLDFGRSYTTQTEVFPALMMRFPNTLKLAALSLVIVTIIGVPLGVWCALRAGKTLDRVIMIVTLAFNSMPSFWLVLILIIFLSVKLNWLPSFGTGTWKHWVIPALGSSLAALAGTCRQTRASMLEVVRSDFITTAKAKGVPERRVTYGHALPNALIPVVTVLGTRFGAMLGGMTVIESVSSVPGIGLYLVQAINVRDYPCVRGAIIYIAVTFSLIMLVVDVLYAFIDPRIRAQYIRRKKKEPTEQAAGQKE